MTLRDRELVQGAFSGLNTRPSAPALGPGQRLGNQREGVQHSELCGRGRPEAGDAVTDRDTLDAVANLVDDAGRVQARIIGKLTGTSPSRKPARSFQSKGLTLVAWTETRT